MDHLRYFFLLALVSMLGVLACDLEQEVDIDLPEYESRVVVECYLELLLALFSSFEPEPSLFFPFSPSQPGISGEYSGG